MLPESQYEAALNALKLHYRQMLRDMVHEIIIHRDDFDGGNANTADEIITKHAVHLRDFDRVYRDLARYVKRELPQGIEALSKDEFRCFSCGYKIGRSDKGCSLCGWTWI